jgi:hypothetical protein
MLINAAYVEFSLSRDIGITINDVLILFVSGPLLPRVLRREHAVVFMRHLSLPLPRVITQASSYYLHFIQYYILILLRSLAVIYR